MRTFRSWGLALATCLGLIFTSVSYAAVPLLSYVESAWMYASADAPAEFMRELVLQASLPQAAGSGAALGLLKQSHGFVQYTADQALTLTT